MSTLESIKLRMANARAQRKKRDDVKTSVDIESMHENVFGFNILIIYRMLTNLKETGELEASIGTNKYPQSVDSKSLSGVSDKVRTNVTSLYSNFRNSISKMENKKFVQGVSYTVFRRVIDFLKETPDVVISKTNDVVKINNELGIRAIVGSNGETVFQKKQNEERYIDSSTGIKFKLNNEDENVSQEEIREFEQHMLDDKFITRERSRTSFMSGETQHATFRGIPKGVVIDMTIAKTTTPVQRNVDGVLKNERVTTETFEIEIEYKSREKDIQGLRRFVTAVSLVYSICNLSGNGYIEFVNRNNPNFRNTVPDEYEKNYVIYRFNRVFADSTANKDRIEKPRVKYLNPNSPNSPNSPDTFKSSNNTTMIFPAPRKNYIRGINDTIDINAARAPTNKPTNLKLANFTNAPDKIGNLLSYARTIKNPYVTIKVDGIRAFLICIDTGTYLVVPPRGIIKIGAVPSEKFEFLLDVEFIERSGRVNVFAFDLIANSKMLEQGPYASYKDKYSKIGFGWPSKYVVRGANKLIHNEDYTYEDHRYDPLRLRYSALKDIRIPEIFSNVFYVAKQYFTKGDLYARTNNAFELIKDGSYIVDGTSFHQDGLILQNGDSIYINNETYKWKPVDKVTIDFRLIKNLTKTTKDSLVYDLFVMENSSATGKTVYRQFDAKNSTSEIKFDLRNGFIHMFDGVPVDVNLLDRKVVECKWDGRDFIGYRFREDKMGFPNKINVAYDNWNDIHNPITTLTMQGSDMKIMRSAHNLVKTNMLNAFVNGGLLVDIGSGRGGDIHKWVNLLNSKAIAGVVCIEPNSENINGENGLVDRIKNTGKDLAPLFRVVGRTAESVELPRAMEAVKNNFIEKLNISEMNTSVTTVAAFFSLTFFFESREKLIALVDNIDKILQPGGHFIGTVLDGFRVKQLLRVAAEHNTDEYKTKTFTIQHDDKSNNDMFGNGIHTTLFDQTSMVKNTGEFIFDFDEFTKILNERGLYLVHDRYLEGIYEAKCADGHSFLIENSSSCCEMLPSGNYAACASSRPVKCRQRDENNHFRNLPKSSLIFSAANREFAFRKGMPSNPNDVVTESKTRVYPDRICGFDIVGELIGSSDEQRDAIAKIEDLLPQQGQPQTPVFRMPSKPTAAFILYYNGYGIAKPQPQTMSELFKDWINRVPDAQKSVYTKMLYTMLKNMKDVVVEPAVGTGSSMSYSVPVAITDCGASQKQYGECVFTLENDSYGYLDDILGTIGLKSTQILEKLSQGRDLTSISKFVDPIEKEYYDIILDSQLKHLESKGLVQNHELTATGTKIVGHVGKLKQKNLGKFPEQKRSTKIDYEGKHSKTINDFMQPTGSIKISEFNPKYSSNKNTMIESVQSPKPQPQPQQSPKPQPVNPMLALTNKIAGKPPAKQQSPKPQPVNPMLALTNKIAGKPPAKQQIPQPQSSAARSIDGIRETLATFVGTNKHVSYTNSVKEKMVGTVIAVDANNATIFNIKTGRNNKVPLSNIML